MYKMKTVHLLITVVALLTGNLGAQTSISAHEAQKHVGENAKVCGVVASTHYADTTRGRPTFINLDEPYPRQVFTIVIWGSDRRKFGNLEEEFRNKDVCVTGEIQEYKGTPEIIARDSSQIMVQRH